MWHVLVDAQELNGKLPSVLEVTILGPNAANVDSGGKEWDVFREVALDVSLATPPLELSGLGNGRRVAWVRAVNDEASSERGSRGRATWVSWERQRDRASVLWVIQHPKTSKREA